MLTWLNPRNRKSRRTEGEHFGRKRDTRVVRSSRKCDICRLSEATLTCEICGKRVCLGCSDVAIGNVEDIASYIIMCEDCLNSPDAYYEIEFL